ncbi:MAG: glycine cleavage system protein GcvH [Aigarchaeota archaeon]|nr:glycine cleavage system protein GcvH [Aigarchaeota archaeon]MDW8092894.1 glycine cleavage system protein GcvH [Nitrososphaerota archaeon]
MLKLGSIELSERYSVPEGLYYTRDHEWVKLTGKRTALIGITDYAQRKLREIIYVELPQPQTRVVQKQVIATVESVKASVDIYAPLTGKLLEVNTKLADSPELINDSPYDDGWLARFEIADESELQTLMEADEYSRYIAELEEEAGEEE